MSVRTIRVVFMEAAHADPQATGILPEGVAGLRAQLLALALDVADRDRVTALRELADLTNTISAVQARLICDLDASQRAADDVADVPEDRQRGVVGRVASALRESPRNAQIAIGVAKALVTEMPHVRGADPGHADVVPGPAAGLRDRMPESARPANRGPAGVR
jgi:hypothetical protein